MSIKDDIRYHVTGLHGIKESRLQRALDMRLNGALVHIYDASPRANERRRRRFRVGKLAIPPGMLNKKKAFAEALQNPGEKYRLSVGPYDIVISLYREFESRVVKLKNENDDLRKRLATLEQTIASLNQEKMKTDDTSDRFGEQTPAPTYMEAAESSRKPRGPGKHRPSKKRHPKRSPVHKRMKTSVKTGTDSLVGERLLIAADSWELEQIEEQKNLETVEMRLSHFLTAQLQHMHDHG